MILRIVSELRGWRLSLQILVLLALRTCLSECKEKSAAAQSDEDPLTCTGANCKTAEMQPSAIHWALAVSLAVALFLGLLRVMRVLRKEDGFTPIRHAPEGMRPVLCGSCQTMQHITMHGRIFICFSCHSANRLQMDILNATEEPQLVAASGPLRKFEFHREGENFYQEIKRSEIADSEAADLIAASNDLVRDAQRPSTTTVVDAGCAVPRAGGDVDVMPTDVEAGETNALPDAANERPSPYQYGCPITDAELTSNPSICSRKSRNSIPGLPTCVVCLEAPGNMVLLPCAHGGVCDGCITRIAQNRAQGGAHCPHCRSNIETIVKIHAVDGDGIQGVEFRIPIAARR